MSFTPFRPPLRRPSSKGLAVSSQDEDQPPAKKRRVSDEAKDLEGDVESNAHVASETSAKWPGQHLPLSQPRKSLLSISMPAPGALPNGREGPQGYFNVLWRKYTTKKHKTWAGDGVLSVKGGYANLQDESGREMGRTVCKIVPELGSIISVGGKEVEIDSAMSKEDFLAGRTFLGARVQPTVRELDEQLRTSVKFNSKPKPIDHKPEMVFQAITSSTSGQSKYKNPMLSSTIMPQIEGEKPVPRHDPTSPGALVMARPTTIPKGKQIVDVVVDPILSRHLREHQREGVKFMYECVMGMHPANGVGAILADEMGLGKTLQVVTLLWTLLKQGPVHTDGPVIKKALVVCPATLVTNWRKEFRKWLGKERIGVFVMDDKKKQRLADFTLGKSYNVMIIGYEMLRNVQEDLRKGAGVDIIICDEGHRLKSAKNKSAEAIKTLDTERRIILSGTPIQNDLGEFYFMVDFVNPGLLGKVNTFKKEFETPILKSRQPEASAKDIEKGKARAQELARLTGTFILRRTSEILSKYLPPKTEYILFCRPTEAQTSVYRNVLASPAFGTVLGSPEASFQLINVLKKLCNSPSLLRAKDDSDGSSNSSIATLLSHIPPSLLRTPGASGKLQVLDNLLYRLHTTTKEKVVIVSHYTSTLDILGNLLSSMDYRWLRLDGTTQVAKRQDLVDRFNKTNADECFAFLLSAKAGGVGLNLIGASRLILYDVDWNPSTEIQAMARIHRDGQKLPCKIYRMLTQGALDEKIYQRQLTKLSLADSVVDNKASSAGFTKEELRDLFSLNESTQCQTHELLGCKCEGLGIMPAEQSAAIVESMKEEAADTADEDSEDDEALLAWRPGMTKVGSGETKKIKTEPGLMKASQLDTYAQELRIKQEGQKVRKDESEMSTLMRFQHIEVAKLAIRGEGGNVGDEDAEVLIEDDVLLGLLKDKETRVSFVFAKTTS